MGVSSLLSASVLIRDGVERAYANIFGSAEFSSFISFTYFGEVILIDEFKN